MQAIILLLHYAAALYSGAVLLRFLAQWLGADFRNPICQALMQITNPVLIPLRRVIPGWKGLDLSSLVLIAIIRITEVLLISLLAGAPIAVGTTLLASLYLCIQTMLGTYTFVLVFQAIGSWINPQPYHPTNLFLNAITTPLLRPLRKRIPPLGGSIDITPMLVLLLIFILQAQVRIWFASIIPSFWVTL